MSEIEETRAILEAAGVTKIRVEAGPVGVLVAGRFDGAGLDGQPHAGHTGIDPETSSDPRDLARRLLAISRANHDRVAAMIAAATPPPPPAPAEQPVDGYDTPEAEETEEPTFAPEDDPLGPPLADESAPNIEVEFVGEAGQGEGHEEPASEDAAPSPVADEAADVFAEPVPDASAEDVGPAADFDFTDADFAPVEELGEPSELPELEAPDLGAEIVDAEAETGGGAFIFGDNLEQKRTAAIGLVTRIALERAPPWTVDDSVHLTELRNFTMGVAEGRWPDDPAQREDLDTLENTLRMINALTAARDAKVAFLVTATRAEIETFDPESDWP